MARRPILQLFVALLAFASIGGSLEIAQGADHVLVIGGGPKPDSSQISLEQNVVFFRNLLTRLGLHPDTLRTLFASGPGNTPDICYHRGMQADLPLQWMSRIFGPTDMMSLQFRHHQLSEVKGPSTRKQILTEIRDLAQKAQPGDRVLLYFTGHGGEGTPENNGHFYTWTKEHLTVRDLARALDEFPPETDVIVVMVQCFSGTFANIIYEKGDPTRPLTKHRRAGFFATLSNRPAAGCTPDTKVANYQEYSTYFWAALGGVDRLGNRVQVVDLDHDGQISLDEAHHYTISASPTIDVPVRTSDLFLRNVVPASVSQNELLPRDMPMSQLLETALPEERFVIETLANKLGLNQENGIKLAMERSGDLAAAWEEDEDEIKRLEAARDRFGARIKRTLVEKWPFLENPWHPSTQSLIGQSSHEFLAAIGAHRELPRYERARTELATVRERKLKAEKEWAQHQRLVRAAQSVALRATLEKSAPADVKQQYQMLRDLENATLLEHDNQIAPRP